MTKIDIAEQFYSIQGEGPHAGTPAIFLRLAGCNLVCGGRENMDRDADEMKPEGDATWVCDTIDVWRSAERRVEPEELVEGWEARGWLESLSGAAHLILTGGEPTLDKHQEAISHLVGILLTRDFEPYIEVETNGTIEPHEEFARYVNQWNVSLKLSNSGMPEDERINPDAIRWYRDLHEEDVFIDACFKFVVSSEDDLEEIDDLVDRFDIPDSMIMLMPAGYTQDRLRETYPEVAEICKSRGWDFTPRLQVDTWNEATGV